MVSEMHVKGIYLGTTLIGRGTSVIIGGLLSGLKRPRDTEELREKTDFFVKPVGQRRAGRAR